MIRFVPLQWAKESARTYFGNATAVRDYRSQIRGNRALVLLTLYLALLLALTGLIYESSMGYNMGSAAYAQYQLSQFYTYVLMLLAGVVTFVTPALSALAVSGERQRRSLDLIFSAPVAPHYFLVGKWISSLRWVAMLIVLALPISAVSIVMGGATWLDAIGAYVILLSAAAVYASMSILVSSFAPSPVSAVVLSYLFVGLYAGPMMSMAAIHTFGFGSPTTPWYAGLSPFTAGVTAPEYQRVAGIDVPNWVLVALASAFITRFVLLAAASAISGYGAKETQRMRQWGVAIVAVLAYALVPITGFGTSGGGFGTLWGASTAILMLPLCVLFPNLLAWGADADRKYRLDGWFDLRKVWAGTPAGALPYLLILIIAAFGASAAKGMVEGHSPTLEFAVRAAWMLAFGFFWWAVAQYLSSITGSLRTARTAVLASLLLVGILPLPLLAPYDGDSTGGLAYSLLAPVILSSGNVAGTHTVVLALFGMLILSAARKIAPPWRTASSGT